MLRPEQVVDDLDGGEGRYRYFDEHGIPSRHRAVPQARQLHGPQRSALLRLLRDESRLRIGPLPQIEAASEVVFQAACDVDGVEVRGPGRQFFLSGGDLRRLDNLERLASVGLGNPERSPARFAFVADHAADADRPVEHVAQVSRLPLGRHIAERGREFPAQLLGDERRDLVRILGDSPVRFS